MKNRLYLFTKKLFHLLNFNVADRTSQLVVSINFLFLLITVIFAIHDFVADYLIGGKFLAGSLRLPVLFLLALGGLLLIRFEKKFAATILTSISPAIMFFVLPLFVEVDYQEMIYLNAIALPANTILPIIIFRVKDNARAISLLCVIVLISNIAIEYYLTFIKADPSVNFYEFYKDHFVLFCLVKVTIWAFFYITINRIMKRKEEDEDTLLDKSTLLEKSNELIHSQKLAIELQNQILGTTNEILEATVLQRTKEIEQKNKRLVEYAYINSHVLRAPLARIKGLITLIEISQEEESRKKYIALLKQSTAELDEVIHTIMHILHEEDQEKLSLFQERIRKLYSEVEL